MKVVVYASDFGGCGYVRLRWFAAHLRSQGCEVECREGIRSQMQRGPVIDRLVGIERIDADVVVFQRVFRASMLLAMLNIQAQGCAVVVDVDDLFTALSPAHPVYAELHPSNPGKSWAVLREAVRCADLVTVSTPALAQAYGGGKARVIRNAVPRAYLAIARQGTSPADPAGVPPTRSQPLADPTGPLRPLHSEATAVSADAPSEPQLDSSLVIGWPGTPTTHPGDLDSAREAVQTLVRSGQARFRAIGSELTLRELGIDGEYQPGVPLADLSYAREVAKLDIGIAPLRDSAFNKAKSWLKPLEYAALGVPFVASPRAEYRELGAGIMAERPRDWLRALRRLLDPEARRAEVERNRAIAARHTVEQRAEQVWEAWSLARERSRRAA